MTNINKEKWKWISGYEGLYKVSDHGNIMSYKRYKNGKLLRLKKDKDGYLEIGIRNRKGKRKFFRVHRLVAKAFIPNPNNYEFINHIDCDPSNNNVNNIEWCSIEYNNKYRFSHGSANNRGEHSSSHKLNNNQVRKIYHLAWDTDMTQVKIAKMFHIRRQIVGSIKNGTTWWSVTGHVPHLPHRKKKVS